MAKKKLTITLALSFTVLVLGLSMQNSLASQNDLIDHFSFNFGKKLMKYLGIDETVKVETRTVVDKVIALDKEGKPLEAREAVAILSSIAWPPYVGYLARAALETRHGENLAASSDEKYAEGLRLLLANEKQEARHIASELLSTIDGRELGYKLTAETEAADGNTSGAQEAVVNYITLAFNRLRNEEAKYLATPEGKRFLKRISNDKAVDYSVISEGKPIECIEFEWLNAILWPEQILGEHGAAMLGDRLNFPDHLMDVVTDVRNHYCHKP